MADTAQEQASEGDVDHCFGDVDAGLVVAHEPAPTEHSGGSAFNYPSLGQDIKALLASETPHDVDNKVEEGDLVLELSAVIGAVDEEMHYPIFRPSNRSDSAWFSSRSRPYDPRVAGIQMASMDHETKAKGILFQAVSCVLRPRKHNSVPRCDFDRLRTHRPRILGEPHHAQDKEFNAHVRLARNRADRGGLAENWAARTVSHARSFAPGPRFRRSATRGVGRRPHQRPSTF